MNNEEKILSILETIDGRLNALEQGQAALEQGQASIRQELAAMQEDITQIKKDTEITRGATNSLIAWADNVSVVTQIKFPVAK